MRKRNELTVQSDQGMYIYTTQTAKSTYQHEVFGSETLVRNTFCFHPSCVYDSSYRHNLHKTALYASIYVPLSGPPGGQSHQSCALHRNGRYSVHWSNPSRGPPRPWRLPHCDGGRRRFPWPRTQPPGTALSMCYDWWNINSVRKGK
jgi:hypothetical protein